MRLGGPASAEVPLGSTFLPPRECYECPRVLQRPRSASQQVFTSPRVFRICPRVLQRLRSATRQVFTSPRVLRICPRVLQRLRSVSQQVFTSPRVLRICPRVLGMRLGRPASVSIPLSGLTSNTRGSKFVRSFKEPASVRNCAHCLFEGLLTLTGRFLL